LTDRSSRVARALAVVAALSPIVVGFVWGARVAGGSDSYCYLEQVERWAHGTMLAPAVDLGSIAPPWPDRWLPIAPTGFVPSPTVAGAIAPICPAGLALTMVPVRLALGREAVYFVVPLLGSLAVAMTYRLARDLAGSVAGALAAVWLAASPIFLYQVVQPMSDVPAAAWWALALWLATRGTGPAGLLAGLATATAVLTRPNLAVLGAVLMGGILLRPHAQDEAPRLKVAIWFCIGALPGAVALALIQHALYGSPARSGYGALSHLFSFSHVPVNLVRYTRWIMETQTPLLLLAVAAPFLLVGRSGQSRETPPRRAAWLAWTRLVFATVVIASYLPYVPFEDWTYVRFLLPAMPPLLALTASTFVVLSAKLRAPWHTWVVVVVGLAVTVFYVHTARNRHAFRVWAQESKFRIAAEHIGKQLPSRATVLTIWHSGSVRYYGHRDTIVWDAIPPDALDDTVEWLRNEGRTTFLLLEAWEEPRFRERFEKADPLGALDWPPIAQFGRDLRLYRVDDRAAYFAGGRVNTESVRLPRPRT
jgi:Dolichyl-phosphate-mannose-protein mannosyltransferase